MRVFTFLAGVSEVKNSLHLSRKHIGVTCIWKKHTGLGCEHRSFVNCPSVHCQKAGEMNVKTSIPLIIGNLLTSKQTVSLIMLLQPTSSAHDGSVYGSQLWPWLRKIHLLISCPDELFAFSCSSQRAAEKTTVIRAGFLTYLCFRLLSCNCRLNRIVPAELSGCLSS